MDNQNIIVKNTLWVAFRKYPEPESLRNGLLMVSEFEEDTENFMEWKFMGHGGDWTRKDKGWYNKVLDFDILIGMVEMFIQYEESRITDEKEVPERYTLVMEHSLWEDGDMDVQAFEGLTKEQLAELEENVKNYPESMIKSENGILSLNIIGSYADNRMTTITL